MTFIQRRLNVDATSAGIVFKQKSIDFIEKCTSSRKASICSSLSRLTEMSYSVIRSWLLQELNIHYHCIGLVVPIIKVNSKSVDKTTLPVPTLPLLNYKEIQ